MSLRRLSHYAARALIVVAATSAVAPVPAQNRAPNEPITLNFKEAEIDSVVGAFGHLLNRTFIVDPRVRGKITLETPKPVSRTLAFDLLKTILRQQGFAVIDTGSLVKVVPEADAKLQSGPVEAGRVPSRTGDEIITQVFNLNHESATNLIPILRPLVSPNNTVTAFPNNNSLIITDYAANLNRLSRIIAALDNPRAGSDVEIVQVKNAVAIDIAMAVSRLLDDSARGGQPGAAGGGGGAPGAATDPGQRVTVLADPRTNAVLLRSQSAAKMQLAKSLIERLDVPASNEQANMRVVYLRNAEAVRLVEVLRGVLSGGEGGQGGFGGYGGGSGGYGGGYGGIGGSQSSRFGQSGSAFQNQSSMFGGSGSSGGAFGSSGSSFGGQSGSLGMGMGSSSQQSQQGMSPVTVNAGGAIIAADPSTNALIITAPEPVYRNVRAVIDKLDARRAQVHIETLIVEVNADTAAEIGIQWQFLNNSSGGGNRVIGGTNLPARDSGNNIIDATTGLLGIGTGLNIGLVRGGTVIGANGVENVVNLGLLARALQSRGDANIRATPNLLTLDNEEARIIIGQNVPFVTGQYTGVAGTAVSNPFQTIERKDVGTSLRVRPQVSEGGAVKMQIFQEVSAVVDSTLAAGLITNRRAIESNVIVDDGQVVVLGGLIQDDISGTVSKVPILGDIPILGRLFRYDSRSQRKTNLLVFLRPIIIKDAAGAWDVTANRYDYIRALSNDARFQQFAPLPNMRAPDLEPLPARPGTPGTPLPPRDPQNLAPGSTEMLNRGDVRPYGQVPTTETTPRPVPQPPPRGIDPGPLNEAPTLDLREGQGVILPRPEQPGAAARPQSQSPLPSTPLGQTVRPAQPQAVQPQFLPSVPQQAQPLPQQAPPLPQQAPPPSVRPPAPRAPTPVPRSAPARPSAPATPAAPDIYNGA